jgi:hypothetical protein
MESPKCHIYVENVPNENFLQGFSIIVRSIFASLSWFSAFSFLK